LSGETIADLGEGSQAAMLAVADYAMVSEDSPLHPVYGPILMQTNSVISSRVIRIEPDGLQLDHTATLTLPVGDLDATDDDAFMVLVESVGDWEVIEPTEADTSGDRIEVPINHFSEVIVAKMLGDFVVDIYQDVINDLDAQQTASAGPLGGQLATIRRSLLCGTTQTLAPGQIPPLGTLLDYLGFESVRISTAPPDANIRIRDHLRQAADVARAAGNPRPHNIDLGTVVAMAMAETGNDVFQALVLAHDVLRDNRRDPRVQEVLANVRGDVGGDESGDRYHLLGMAVFAFAYEHQRATGNLSSWWLSPPPEVTAYIEEEWVSRGLSDDPVEFVIDRRGAGLGRNVLADYNLADADRAVLCDELGAGATTSTTTTSTTTTVNDPDGIENGRYIGTVSISGEVIGPAFQIVESTVELDVTDADVQIAVEYTVLATVRERQTGNEESFCDATLRFTYVGESAPAVALADVALVASFQDLVATAGPECGAVGSLETTFEEEFQSGAYAIPLTMSGSFVNGRFDGTLTGNRTPLSITASTSS
jgi:hypothetical protein